MFSIDTSFSLHGSLNIFSSVKNSSIGNFHSLPSPVCRTWVVFLCSYIKSHLRNPVPAVLFYFKALVENPNKDFTTSIPFIQHKLEQALVVRMKILAAKLTPPMAECYPSRSWDPWRPQLPILIPKHHSWLQFNLVLLQKTARNVLHDWSNLLLFCIPCNDLNMSSSIFDSTWFLSERHCIFQDVLWIKRSL